MQPNLISLSLFFPVYNEAAALPKLIHDAQADLAAMNIKDYELIIVDDGSRDGSDALARQLAAKFPTVRVVQHKTNLGYGAALKSGFAAATKQWVMYTDGDGQFRVADLERFFPYIERYSVILGYRLHRQDHWGRKLNAHLWGILVWAVLGMRVKDLDCAFKLIRRDALQQVQPLESSGAVISAELLAKLRRKGFKFVQVGVSHYPRRAGQPTGANPKVIVRALAELIRLRLRISRFNSAAH